MVYTKNTDGTYVDLPLTGFPASVDQWQDYIDVTADLITLANQYKTKLAAGDYAGAKAILDGDTSGNLKRAMITAINFNQLKQAIMAIERMWSEDISTYVVSQAFMGEVYRLVGGTEITAAGNLNTYTSVGNYYCQSDTIAAQMANAPVQTAFTMRVISSNGVAQTGSTQYVRQVIVPNDVTTGLCFERSGLTTNSGTSWTFGAWAKYATEEAVTKVAADLTTLSGTVNTLSSNLSTEISRAKAAENTKAATADLTSGVITVKNATNATNATNAGYATKATSADSATNATNATNAGYATSAGNSDKVDGFHVGWDGATLSLWT